MGTALLEALGRIGGGAALPGWVAEASPEAAVPAFVSSIAAGELEEFLALEALAAIGNGNGNGPSSAGAGAASGGVPQTVAAAVAADATNGWKVFGALAALIASLPLGGAPLESATEAFLDLAAATLAACGNSTEASVGAFTDLALPCLADSFRSEPGKRPYVVKILFAFAG